LPLRGAALFRSFRIARPVEKEAEKKPICSAVLRETGFFSASFFCFLAGLGGLTTSMLDLFFIALSIAFFVLAALYVRFCEKA